MELRKVFFGRVLGKKRGESGEALLWRYGRGVVRDKPLYAYKPLFASYLSIFKGALIQ